MPLSNQKKEELRKEFRKIGSGSVRFISTRDEVCDYWLTIIDSLIDEKVKDIEKEKKDIPYPGEDGNTIFANGYNQGIDAAIKVLENK